MQNISGNWEEGGLMFVTLLNRYKFLYELDNTTSHIHVVCLCGTSSMMAVSILVSCDLLQKIS